MHEGKYSRQRKYKVCGIGKSLECFRMLKGSVVTGVHTANACVESGELTVVLVHIFVNYSKEFSLYTKISRYH